MRPGAMTQQVECSPRIIRRRDRSVAKIRQSASPADVLSRHEPSMLGCAALRDLPHSQTKRSCFHLRQAMENHLRAAAPPSQLALFATNHAPGGGNVIGYARSKTLKTDALNKSGYASRDKIKQLLSEGAGAMPRYTEYTKKNGDVVPARLSSSELDEVSGYVLLRASQDWK
eukprot:TRINITY_DN2370_c0_g1_i2.p1 TRINITY_DN2370_c0_g1~~TRINITY_DN2370_c0_g1_i2.p1  ORF type:complete len:172 (-),score=24.13 TRINITY_DN2370_c0_g1_i2:212-727(-)